MNNCAHVKEESFRFYILIMLAFYIHQILELINPLFQYCDRVYHTYKELWEDLRVLFM